MRTLYTIILVLFISFTQAHSQEYQIKAKIEKLKKEFDQLTKEKQAEYIRLKRKAFKSSEKAKYFTCMVAINDAQRIFRGDLDLLLLNGVCRAQIHDVDCAINLYKQVLEVDPNHLYTLMNIIEINFFAARYEDAVEQIEGMNKLFDSRANGQRMPLLDFKYLICLTKLSKKNPEKYNARLTQLREKYTYMDDHPFYYFANALKSFDDGDKQEGLVWILKSYLIFKKPQLIETWNKALVDTEYIGAHEIMFKRREEQ